MRASCRRGPGRSWLGLPIALVAAAGLVAGCSKQAAPRPPNILLIAIDTLRADALGAYGQTAPTSPNLDRFLEGAVVFDDAQTVAPWTLPAFASLMTGELPSTHRCVRFESSLSPRFDTLAERLKGAGYETAAIVSHVFLASDYGLAQGFDDYDETLVLEDGRQSHRAISSPELSSRAIDWLEARARAPEEPFLLWVHYFDPHWFYHRHDAVDRDFGPGLRGRYEEEVAFTDAHIGRVLDRLEALGLRENTIVVLVADHGEEFFEHGYKQHGQSLYEAAVHVPLAIRAPGFEPRRVADTVSLVDVLPTLLELVGLPHEDGLPGRSLVGLMRGEAAEARPALVESRLHLRKDADLEAWVTGRWKLVLEWPKSADPLVLKTDAGPKRILLFDRVADPGEDENVADAHPEIVDRLVGQLTEARTRAESLADERLGAREHEPARALSEDRREHLRALGYIESEAPAPEPVADPPG